MNYYEQKKLQIGTFGTGKAQRKLASVMANQVDELKQAEIERVKIARQQAGIKEPKPPPVFAEQQWRKP